MCGHAHRLVSGAASHGAPPLRTKVAPGRLAAADLGAVFLQQGSGKSTLVEQLVNLLRHTGRAAVDVSIDDFYLRFQVRLSTSPIVC